MTAKDKKSAKRFLSTDSIRSIFKGSIKDKKNLITENDPVHTHQAENIPELIEQLDTPPKLEASSSTAFTEMKHFRPTRLWRPWRRNLFPFLLRESKLERHLPSEFLLTFC
jgi:hypothetical protein